MPDDETMLAQGTVDFRNEERMARYGRTLQVPACDRCTLGVMDATNSHYLGTCGCECHQPSLAFCTQDEGCQADAGDHFESCPVEARLRETFGF